MLALVNSAPQLLNIKQILEHYANHQIEIIVRRSRFELKKAEDRAHIVAGLIKALDNIDEIITIIRSSNDDSEASARMFERFEITPIQAKAILDMQFRRLTGLQREKLDNEYTELVALIEDLKDILSNHFRVVEIVKNDLLEIKNKFADPRRSEIIEADVDMMDEDLIPREDIVVSLTMNGYIKRTTLDSFNAQNRGGKGVKGMSTYEDDEIDQFLALSTHDYLMIFTNKGRVYRLRGFNIPAANRTAKGIPVVNLINLNEGEFVKTFLKVPHGEIDSLVSDDKDQDDSRFVFFVTKQGLVKRVDVKEFESIRQNGKIAITLKEDDELVSVKMTNGNNEIIIGGDNGKAVRFNENDVRVMGRSASGVKGFDVDGGEVVGVATDREGKYILAITQLGYGKRTDIDEYRLTKRGAKGVKTVNVTEKNGKLVSLRAVNGDEEVLVMSAEGIVIRTAVSNIGVYGRSTIGVRIINVGQEDSVASVAVLKPNVVEEEVDAKEVISPEAASE